VPSNKNIKTLETIKEKQTKSKAAVFIDYRGLGVNKLNELRDKVRDAGGELFVTKNTLLRITYGNDQLSTLLTGPTAAVFAYEDEVAPLKAVAEFSKENELPTFTAGYFEDKVLSPEEIDQLSKLPGKDELRAKVVGSLAAPLSGMVNVLQGNIRKMVYVLDAIRAQKAQE
jgi:large subunit ribosomal protein L10